MSVEKKKKPISQFPGKKGAMEEEKEVPYQEGVHYSVNDENDDHESGVEMYSDMTDIGPKKFVEDRGGSEDLTE